MHSSGPEWSGDTAANDRRGNVMGPMLHESEWDENTGISLGLAARWWG